MNLYRRVRSPFWWADVTVDGGTRERFSTKRRHLLPLDDIKDPKRLTPAQAEAKRHAEAVVANHIKAKLDTSQLGKLQEITLASALNTYLSTQTRAADYRNTESRKRKLLGEGEEYADRYHLDPKMLFHKLTTQVVENLKKERLKEGNSPRTINHELQVLGHAYRQLAAGGDVLIKPGVQFAKFKVKDKLRWLTEEEEIRLLAELDPRRGFRYTMKRLGKSHEVHVPFEDLDTIKQRKLQDQYDLVVFLLDTGARYSEAAGITWDAIDTHNWRSINIYRSKVGNEGVLAQTRRLREVIQRRWKEKRNSPYVFPSYTDSDAPRGHAIGGITNAIERAKLNPDYKVKREGKVTPHSFRDTFASRLVQGKRNPDGSWLVKPVPLERVQKLLGHTNPKQTQKYAHLVPDDVAEDAVLALDAYHEARGVTHETHETH